MMTLVTTNGLSSMTEAGTAVPRSGEAIRVLVVDDHVLYRRGLELVLGQEADIDIVGEAGDGHEAIRRTEELLPDVVLMDVRMPRRSGIEACTAIKELVPSTKIVMLTISDEESDLYEAVRAGANGYLLKDVPGEQIADGIRAVSTGQSLISPSMASKLLSEFALMIKRHEERPAMPVPRLTERELEVLKLVARGMANRDIAKALFISENTVKNHVRNILEKLQLHSRMEAAMYAVREKLLDLPE
ncbi:LuxR family two component transcriptional regulator [Oryzihumus leptocrescens]|jgi:two-component system NarL family response regulator|uniref:LuxR family two component transcriptional regulator n=1 Tax=Oryzihumus leptocrescens TaxID=297536 RepID=A0A542ZGH0_9MICO|nr:LuxR family two component transcriptional regulator [Oryzihumus leptocrescens]